MRRRINLECDGRTTGEILERLAREIEGPEDGPRLVLHVKNVKRLNDSLCRLIRRLFALVNERDLKVSIVDPTGCTAVLWEALGGSIHVEVCRSEDEISEPLNVLVVEDTPDSREFLVTLLESAGHRVTAVATGEEAVVAGTRGRFDLALVDLVLPDFDGMSVAAALQSSGTPLIAMSAYLDRWKSEDFARAGFRAQLRKPFMTAELLAALRA